MFVNTYSNFSSYSLMLLFPLILSYYFSFSYFVISKFSVENRLLFLILYPSYQSSHKLLNVSVQMITIIYKDSNNITVNIEWLEKGMFILQKEYE